MKAAQGATGDYTRAHASFRNPHDGVASGVCPDKSKTELQGLCLGGSRVCVGDLGRRFWGERRRGRLQREIEKREGSATRETNHTL